VNPNAPERLVRFVLTFCCCGVLVNDGEVIVKAAPILRWTLGRQLLDVVAFYKRKGQLLDVAFLEVV
jgi:hypothetical protein